MTRRPDPLPLYTEVAQEIEADEARLRARADDLARRAEGDHGLGHTADLWADMQADATDRRGLEPAAVIVLAAALTLGAILGWAARGLWG